MTRDTPRPCRLRSQLNVHSRSKLAGESTYRLPALQPASLASSASSEGDSQNPCSQTCWQFLWILKIFFFVKILECGDSGSEKPSDLTWTHLCSRTSGRRWANEADSTCYLAIEENSRPWIVSPNKIWPWLAACLALITTHHTASSHRRGSEWTRWWRHTIE